MHAIATRERSTRGGPSRVDRHLVVSIRPIEAIDAAGLSAFYAALSPESRRRRFLGSGVGLSEAQASRMAQVDHRSADGYVAVLHEAGPSDGEIVGHVCLEPCGDGMDEVAVAVADRVQDRGIGRRLVREAVVSARRRGLRGLHASLFHENTAMRRLLLGTGVPVTRTGRDGAVLEVALPLG